MDSASVAADFNSVLEAVVGLAEKPVHLEKEVQVQAAGHPGTRGPGPKKYPVEARQVHQGPSKDMARQEALQKDQHPSVEKDPAAVADKADMVVMDPYRSAVGADHQGADPVRILIAASQSAVNRMALKKEKGEHPEVVD